MNIVPITRGYFNYGNEEINGYNYSYLSDATGPFTLQTQYRKGGTCTMSRINCPRCTLQMPGWMISGGWFTTLRYVWLCSNDESYRGMDN